VSDPEDAKRLVQFTLGHFGRLDVLVKQRRHRPRAEFVDIAVEDFDRVLRCEPARRLPVRSGRLRAQLLAQEPERAGARGVIINMSSVNAVLAIANQVPYTVSKGALNQLTKVMSISLARRACA